MDRITVSTEVDGVTYEATVDADGACSIGTGGQRSTARWVPATGELISDADIPEVVFDTLAEQLAERVAGKAS